MMEDLAANWLPVLDASCLFLWKTRREMICRAGPHRRIDATVAAFLRSLSGANKRPAMIAAYRIDLW